MGSEIIRLSKQQLAVLRYLAEHGPATIWELRMFYGDYASAWRSIQKLIDMGFTKKLNDKIHITRKGKRALSLFLTEDILVELFENYGFF